MGAREPHILGVLLVLLAVAGLAGATDVSGTIDEHTTWTLGQSPYTVIDTVTVSAGVVLTIEPGVRVDFVGSSALVANGTLDAVGTAEEPIVFVGGGSADPAATIAIEDATGESRISHSVVSHFYNGVQTRVTCEITNNVIQQNRNAGVMVFANYVTPEPVVAHNVILDNDYGIDLWNTNSVKLFAGTYVYNTIVRCSAAGVRVHDLYGHCEPVVVSHSIIAFNRFGLLSEAQEILSDHNDLWRNGTGFHPPGMPSTADISADPLFADPFTWDFQLCDCSLARVAGECGTEIGAYGNGAVVPLNPREYAMAPTTSGVLVRDEAWSGTVTVTDTVTVPRGYLLRMLPGTVVDFEGSAGLVVNGLLIADGLADTRVELTGGGASGPLDESSRIWLDGTPGEASLTSCDISMFYDGIVAENSCSGHCRVSDCTIADNERYGVRVESTYEGSHPVLVNNVVDGNQTGVVLSQTNSAKRVHGTYEFNTIVHSLDIGFYLYDMYGGQGLAVRNSIVALNDVGVASWAGGVSQVDFVSEYNDVWGNAVADYFSYWGVMEPGVGDISEDPLFVDGGGADYTLLPGSPALTASSESGEIGAFGSMPQTVWPLPCDGVLFCDGFELGDASVWPETTGGR